MARFALIGGIVLLIVGAGALLRSMMSHDAVESAPVSDLVGSVGLIMLLPTDEQPTVAKVTDLAMVKDQPFFKHAEIGDVVLTYPSTGRTILYSPARNMIIEVGPIAVEE